MSFTLKAEAGAVSIDRAEVRRALGILIDPARASELVGLPSGRSRPCAGSDLDAAARAAQDLSDGAGVYYRINPCRPGLAKAANNGDIIARRWLLVDCDPVRPQGENATDLEKAAGIEQARAAGELLSSHGWPDPLWVDSGNGVQLLYRIDLPAETLSRQWLKAILARIGDETDTDASKIDRGVHRANQLAKLPGTWARKGPHSPERPHRMARLVSVPTTIEVVTAEQLGAMAGMAAGGTRNPQPKGGSPSPPPSATSPTNGHANGHAAAKNPWGAKATAHTLDGYVRSAIRRECAIVEMTPQGDRNNALNTAAFNLGTMASWPEMDHADAKLALWEAAKRAGLEDEETRKTIASGWDSGAGKGRARPADQPAGKPKVARPTTKPLDPNKRLIVWAKDITPRKVDWLWPGRIPVGKATTFAGQTGMGKTFAVCDIAARISRGAEIPFCGGECFRQGKVLIISAEDDADDTIVPRLIDLGADLSQIAFLSPNAEADFNLGALELLNNSLDQMAGDVRMVAIDPPTSYLAGADDHKNAEIRALLAPLRRWTTERRIALVLITHINKGGAGKVDAMARVMGSAAWVQAVRAAHMFVQDPDAKGKSLFLPLKVNNARKPPGIGYRIAEQADGRVVIDWLGEVDTSPEDALNNTPKKSRGICAVEWLIERFRERREWSSDELKQAATAFGLSRNALFSPEVNGLPIKKRRRADANGDPAWWWVALPGWPDLVGTIGTVGTLDPKP